MAGQKFTLTFDANLNVSQMKGALGEIQKSLNGLNLPQNVTKGLMGTFQKLSEEIRNFEVAANKDITGKADFSKLEKSADRINSLFERLKVQVKDLKGLSGKDLEKLFPDNIVKNIQNANKAFSNYSSTVKNATSDLNKAEKAVQKLNDQIAKENSKNVVTGDQFKALKDSVKNAENDLENYQSRLDELRQRQVEMESTLSQPMKSSKYRALIKEIEDTEKEAKRLQIELDNLTKKQANTTTNTQHAKDLADLNAKYSEAVTKLTEFQNKLNEIQSTQSGGGLSQLIEEVGRLTGLDMSKFSQDVQGVGQAIQTYLNQQLNQLSSNLNKTEQDVNNFGDAFRNNTDDVRAAGEALRQYDTQMREVDMLRSRIQYFFGLNNAIQLVKRTMRDAYETVKDLDKAMTETAVVTDFSVGDMWSQLPDYTKRANELGVTTQAAYEAATLYYQQGLNTNEVMAMSNETLKMARIAGLDAAEATDRMTNAIRGFNMEINTTNAQRIDDVYSRLAAISASNVDEISTAMTKVASLAHNANMEFETTAAFLAQIIETTRESAETAGTALKTVVARFSEVKKLVDENELKGQDEEGQVIDVNKVSQALRTAGIDLNKYFLGEVGLDDIFMELASKWDSLTTLQQRYIATQAAGSRQQSRFIALMSDYARTQELVGEAYEANGASAKQFAKTQESLESKLARLKNAWNEFAMGILNSDLIKAGVDTLTTILNVINSLTSGFGALNSGAGSFVNTFAKLALLIGALNVGKGLSAGLLGSAVSLIGGQGASAAGFRNIAATAMFGATRAGTMQNAGIGQILAQGFISPFGGIATGAGKAGKAIWGGAQSLGAFLGVGTSKATLAASGGMSWLAGGAGAGGAGVAAGLTGLITALGAVAAAGTAAYVIIKKLYDASPTGQVKIAEKYASAMSTVADEARKAESDIKKVQESYNNYNEAIDKANTSSERSTAIQERNDYITSLLEQNSAYAEYLTTTFENGEILLTLDSDALAAAVDKIAEGAVKASAYSEIANAILSGQQANLYRSKLAGVDLENRTRFEGVDSWTGETYYSNLSDAEYAKYLRYQTQAEHSDAQMRSYVEHAAAQLIDTNVLSDETASVVAHFISEGFNAADIQSKVDSQKRADWWEGNATENQLRAEYARLYGTQAAEGTKKSELAQSVAFAQVMEETTETQIEKLQSLLTGENGSLYESILSAASGIGEINSVNLSNINFEDGAEGLFSALNIDPTNFEALETAAGLATGSLQKQIIAQAKLIKDIQKVNKTKIYDNLLHAGIDVTKAVQDMVNNMSPEQAEKIADITTKAQGTLSPELYRGLLTHIPQLMQSEELNDIQNFFNSFDLSDPINAFLQLRAAEEKAQPRGMFEGLLKAIEQTNAALFDSGNLFQTFLTSSEYDDLTESLDEFIEKNGEISGENIEELAKNCKGLKAVLDNDKISAQGLAKALTALQQGNAPIEGLTTRVLEALSSFNDFNTMLEEISNTIANFDPGRDFGEGSDFLVQQADNLLELIDGYEFGNEQTRNIYDLFFGKGAYDNFMSEWGTRGIEEYADLMKAQVEQLKDWADSNSYGFMRDFAGNQALGITQIGDYDFKWDTQGRTTEQLIAEVQKQANISREAAEMVIEGFAAQSYDFATELQQNDYSAFLENFSTSASNTRTITEQELAALGAAFGKTSDEIYADLEKLRNEKGIDIPIRVNWQDENGANLTGEALFNEFTEKIGNFQEYVQDYMNNGQIDASALLGGLTSTGLTSSQASEVADKIASSIDGAMLSKTISVPKLDEDGITITSEDITISADSMEGLTAAENAAIEAANYELVAQKLAEQDLSGLQTNLDTVIINAGTNLTTTLNAACTAVDASGVGTAITNAGAIAASNIQSLIASTPMYGTVILTATGTAAGALGGIVTSYAGGSANRKIQPGWALTGEEAPEIVWNKERGYAYITGAKGPEFRTLYPGDRVFNAQETSRILQNSSFAKGGIFGSYASGGYNPDKLPGGSGSGSGSGDSDNSNPTVWENELDWLYNLMEDIAELERQQTRIAEKHDRYLSDISKTGRDLYNLTQEELNNLYTQRDNQREALTRRRQEMSEQLGISGYSNYVWWNDKDQTIEIDWDAIEAIQDKDEYDEVTDLIDRVEKIQDEMDDASDALFDIEGKIKELEERYLQEFTEFQQRILDAVVKQYQDSIDNLTELNDTLNDTNASILESLQKEIEYSRQIRDNTDTENNIADMEARIAFLRRDTTGANEAEIRDLEKQLENARESYSDTLIDQQLDRLSEANEQAAEQRQQQIELMTAQLDYWQENGGLWDEVARLLEEGMSSEGSLIGGSELEQVLQNAEGWNAMSQQQREVWGNELISSANQAGAYLLKISEGLDSLSAGIWALIPASSVTSEKLQYATGGMNTQTGWAWLDGTANDPEYVLNARQTDAFLRLADILPSMFDGGGNVTNNLGGNVYVELTMNVGEINNDYDVDRMVERVKSDIYQASSYRNVNAVNFQR